MGRSTKGKKTAGTSDQKIGRAGGERRRNAGRHNWTGENWKRGSLELVPQESGRYEPLHSSLKTPTDARAEGNTAKRKAEEKRSKGSLGGGIFFY